MKPFTPPAALAAKLAQRPGLIVLECDCECNSMHNGRLLGSWGLSKPPYIWNGKEPLWRLRGKQPKPGDWIEEYQTDVDDHATAMVPCPLQTGETYQLPDGSTYRVASVECRRVRSVTEAEAKDYGCDCRSDLAWGRYGAHGATMADTAVAHGYRAHFEESFTAAHGAAAWDEDVWSWFITRESSERE